MELLVVLPEYQRKGIGTVLLNEIKEQAQKEGIKEMALRTGCYMDAYEIYKNMDLKIREMTKDSW